MRHWLATTSVIACATLGAHSALAATRQGDDFGSSSLTVTSAAVAEGAQDAQQEEAAPAQVAEAAPGDWEVRLTPYLWLAGTKGTVGLPRFGQTVDIDQSFSDVLNNLDFAFMGALEVRHRRLVAMTDVMYLDLSAKAENIRDIRFLSGRVKAKMLIASAAAGYRVIEDGPIAIDVLAGARYSSLDVDLSLAAGPLTFDRDASPSDISPLVGLRARFPLADRWSWALYGDVGVGGGSAIKGQVVGTVQWDISNRWRAIAGYRYMALDQEGERLVFDADMKGPLLGVSYRF